MHRTTAITRTLEWFRNAGLLSSDEVGMVHSLFEQEFQFAEALALADSIHVHLRVDDTDALPHEAFLQQGGRYDHGKSGYIKYSFPDGLNMIFSSIPVAQDNLAETPENRRPRPHVDHLGIDLRREEAPVKSGFDELPGRADGLGWGHIPQGGKGRPVYCCHIEVAQKHWIYPPEGAPGPGVPLEFAYGPLKTNEFKAGCDLRPSSPVVHLASTAGRSCH